MLQALAVMRLVIANLNYSSWSMRAWLVLEAAGVEFKTFDVGMFSQDGWKERILQFSGAGKVPILVDGSSSIHESLAIAETVAERYPEAKLWPEDPARRARARAISAEMASGFPALRNSMPCNLRGRARTTPTGDELEANVRRVFDIWEASLSTSPGDFLFGDFGIADAMYMPVASRFRTYGVQLPGFAEAYSRAIFSHPAVARLEALASETDPIERYDAFLK